MRKLSFYDTETVAELAWPEASQKITKRSPATKVFTDFNQYEPLVIEASMSALEAEKLMQQSHVRLKLVVDSSDHFLGIISLDDLSTQEVMKKLSEGYQREELFVTDFMRPRSVLKAFSYAEITAATIGDIINSLQGSGQQHALVIDREHHKIRGIISSSDIARKLKLPIDIDNKSSFAHIFAVVNHRIAS